MGKTAIIRPCPASKSLFLLHHFLNIFISARHKWKTRKLGWPATHFLDGKVATFLFPDKDRPVSIQIDRPATKPSLIVKVQDAVLLQWNLHGMIFTRFQKFH